MKDFDGKTVILTGASSGIGYSLLNFFIKKSAIVYAVSRNEREITEKNKDKVSNILQKNGIYFEIIGKTQKEVLEISKDFSVKISDLNKFNSFWFKNYFGENYAD